MDWTYSLMPIQDSTDGSWDTKTWDISKKNGQFCYLGDMLDVDAAMQLRT